MIYEFNLLHHVGVVASSKQIWPIKKKINEGDEKNKQEKHSWNFFFISWNKLVFFEMFFLFPEINWFFSQIYNNLMRTLGRKKHVFLVMRGLNLMCALI